MLGGSAAVPVHSLGRTIASLEYMTNGIVVRYCEAATRKKKSSGGFQIGPEYFSNLFDVISSQMSESEEWNQEKREKLDKVKDSIKKALGSTEVKSGDVWVSEERSIFCSKMEEVPAAIQKAYEAYLGILSLIREGETVLPSDIGYVM